VNTKRTTSDVAAMMPHVLSGLCRSKRMNRTKIATINTRRAKITTSGLRKTERPNTRRTANMTRAFAPCESASYLCRRLLSTLSSPYRALITMDDTERRNRAQLTGVGPLFTRLPRSRVLGSPYPASCIAPVLTCQDSRSEALVLEPATTTCCGSG
jgi:hypothetical protein